MSAEAPGLGTQESNSYEDIVLGAGFRTWMIEQGSCAHTISRVTSVARSRRRDWGTLDVPIDVVEEWLSHFDNSGTYRSYRSYLDMMYRWLVVSGQLAASPLPQLPRGRKTVPLTRAQSDAYDLAGYTRFMQGWGASEGTMDARLQVARVVAKAWPDPGSVTPADISDFLSDPAFSAWTRTTYYGHAHALFAWLAEAGAIPTDPTAKVRRPRPPKNRPRPLSPDEVSLIMSDATGDLRVWLLLGMYAGFRAHEAAKIQGRDVTQDTIYVRGKGGKDAAIPTHPTLWALAQDRPSGLWFPARRGHVAATALSTKVTHHFRSHGVEGSYHRCRHTYATNLLRAGVNLRIVQTLMRHESLTSTAAYLAVDEDERAAAVRLLGLGDPPADPSGTW